MEVSGTDPVLRILPQHRQAPGLHAGFWLRAVAWCIDALIVGALTLLVIAGAEWAAVLPLASAHSRYAFGVFVWVLPVSFAVTWLYYALCESSRWQATPGKLALGLRVTDEHGCRIGFARASARWVGMLVSGVIAYIGYLLAAWTPRKQALHDLMAGCCVVRAEGLRAWQHAEAVPLPASLPGDAPASGMPGWAIALLVLGVGVFLVLPFLTVASFIAVPAYHDYRVRTEVAAGLAATARARALVGEYIGQRGALPVDNRALGLPAPDAVRARYVRSVRVADGKLIVTLGNAADVHVRGGHLVVSPVGNAARLRWHCASPDIQTRYLPRECRD